MPRTWSDEALVLRTYNVGDTDRFCILLTKNYGRIAARAHGVRRLLSRRGAGLLPLHRVQVSWDERTQGRLIVSSACIDPYAPSWTDPHAFSCAHQGVELILKLTEEGTPVPEIFDLTASFLAACKGEHPHHLVQVFTLQLLRLLGSLPSVTHSSTSYQPFRLEDAVVFSPTSGGLSTSVEDRHGRRMSQALRVFLSRALEADLQYLPSCTVTLASELREFIQSLLGNQLGVSLVSPFVNLAFSSTVTPI